MSEKIIIIGASGHGKVIRDIVQSSGDVFCGYLDDDLAKPDVLGPVSDCVKYPDCKFVIAIGNNAIRKKIAEAYPMLSYHTAIHPRAVIADSAKIGQGTAVMANGVVNADACIGQHCIINTLSVVEHDCKISDYVHLSPGAVLCGTVMVGENCHIGANAVVKNNIAVTSGVTVGCGGCVVKDIQDAGVYAGVPVERLRS